MDSIKIHADKRWMGPDGFGGESLWAVELTSNTARINNTPFFTYGLSLNDTVRVDSDGEIIELVEYSGLKNLRALKLDGTDEDLKSLADDVERLGGVAEGGFGCLLAVSITANLVDRLTHLFEANGWSWENGN